MTTSKDLIERSLQVEALQKEAALSFFEGRRADQGYREPESNAIKETTLTGLATGALALTGLKYLQGMPSLASKASFLGRVAGPAAVLTGAAIGLASHNYNKESTLRRNEELTNKALSDEEFRQRLLNSSTNRMNHPAVQATKSSILAAISGNPLEAAAAYGTSAYAGVKSNEFNQQRVEELRQRVEQLDKAASVASMTKSLMPKIAPTVGTKSMAAQAGALSGAKTALPKGTAPMAKSAGLARQIAGAVRGTGSLVSSGVKGFGDVLTGHEVRGIVAKHKNIPLNPEDVNVLSRFKNRHKMNDLYTMSDKQARDYVKDSKPVAKELERAIDRRNASRVIAGAGALAATVKITEPKKQETYYDYQNVHLPR